MLGHETSVVQQTLIAINGIVEVIYNIYSIIYVSSNAPALLL